MIPIAFAFLAATGLQATPSAPASAVLPAAAAPITVSPAEKPICRRMPPEIGTNLPGKRICHSAREWAEIHRADDRIIDSYRAPTGQGYTPNGF